MLDDLKKYNSIGGKEELLYYIQHVLGNRILNHKDVILLCEHAPGQLVMKPLALKEFLLYLKIIELSVNQDQIFVTKTIVDAIENSDLLVEMIIRATIEELYSDKVLSINTFSFNVETESYFFANSIFPLELAAVRNILISLEFLSVKQNEHIFCYEVSEKYEALLLDIIPNKKRTMDITQLMEKLRENTLVGEQAEIFVLEYEKRRLGYLQNASRVKRISEIDVAAGYDIISFMDVEDQKYNRFIEVKAVSKNNGFYWSKNEIETAKIKKEKYYLYLVEIEKITMESYHPLIIKNPANELLNSDEWMMIAQNYSVCHI